MFSPRGKKDSETKVSHSKCIIGEFHMPPRPLYSHLHIMALINTLSGRENDGKHVTGGSDKSATKINRSSIFFSLRGKLQEIPIFKTIAACEFTALKSLLAISMCQKVAAGSNYR